LGRQIDSSYSCGHGKLLADNPVAPGWDFVGVVEELAGSVKNGVGGRVAGFPITGGQQRFICVSEDDIIPVPQRWEAPQICITQPASSIAGCKTEHLSWRLASVSDSSRRRTKFRILGSGFWRTRTREP